MRASGRSAAQVAARSAAGGSRGSRPDRRGPTRCAMRSREARGSPRRRSPSWRGSSRTRSGKVWSSGHSVRFEIALVVAAHLARRDLDRLERVAVRRAREARRPAPPSQPIQRPAERAQRGIERGHEPAAGALAPAVPRRPSPHRHGQAVARDDQVIEVHGGGMLRSIPARCLSRITAMEDAMSGLDLAVIGNCTWGGLLDPRGAARLGLPAALRLGPAVSRRCSTATAATTACSRSSSPTSRAASSTTTATRRSS